MTPETAKAIRIAWHSAREQLLANHPRVAEYARQCFNAPATMVLRRMAIDDLLGTHGVEYLGTSRRTNAEVYYCNAGDSYAATIIFSGNALRVGCWGDLIEKRSVRERGAFEG